MQVGSWEFRSTGSCILKSPSAMRKTNRWGGTTFRRRNHELHHITARLLPGFLCSHPYSHTLLLKVAFFSPCPFSINKTEPYFMQLYDTSFFVCVLEWKYGENFRVCWWLQAHPGNGHNGWTVSLINIGNGRNKWHTTQAAESKGQSRDACLCSCCPGPVTQTCTISTIAHSCSGRAKPVVLREQANHVPGEKGEESVQN